MIQRLSDQLGLPLDADSLDHRDAALIARVLPSLRWFNRRYFRLRCEGEAQLRPGPALYVANHNGGILGPDLFCTLGMLWHALGPEAPLYALAHDFAMRVVTPLGRQLKRVGAIRASPRNALRALSAGAGVLVYPGGEQDAYRHYRRRNEVVILPRSGFVEVAREAGVPIVPIVAHGAHRSAIIFHEGAGLGRRLGLRRLARIEHFPFALALPWILAAGPWVPYLPLPLPIRLRVLPPIRPARGEGALDVARRVEGAMNDALAEMAR